MMTWLVVLAVVWTVTAFLVGMFIGRVIRLRDQDGPGGEG